MESQFHLEAPPGFEGLDPDIPIEVYERKLPHWRQTGASYFVTFRLGDSLPKQQRAFLEKLRSEWMREHPAPRSRSMLQELAERFHQHAEEFLDRGYGSCIFKDPIFVRELEQALLHFQNERYFISCWTVMPNHCHLVIRPFSGWSLESILASIKGYCARRLNLIRMRRGSIWQSESYDRIIRDEQHLWAVIQYIGRNPRLAHLPKEQWHRWIDPSWQLAGWHFVDDEA